MVADNEHAHMKYTVNQIGCVTFAHPYIYKMLPHYFSDIEYIKHLIPANLTVNVMNKLIHR